MSAFSRFGSVALSGLFVLASCSLVVDKDVGIGIGGICKQASDCQGSGAFCDEGVCSSPCRADGECPSGSACVADKCTRPLTAGFIYVGVPEDEGWTLTHDLGRKDAEKALPWLKTLSENNIFLTETGEQTIDKMVAQGATVIFATSDSLRQASLNKAKQYPNVQFFVCSGLALAPNLVSYFARSYQAWYVAGAMAAKKSATGHIGFAGSFINPELVRHINAFTQGALSVNPKAQVEVLWEGFWFDQDWAFGKEKGDTRINPANGKSEKAPREQIITEQLIAHGADVIAHGSDTSRTVETVERITTLDKVWLPKAGSSPVTYEEVANPYKAKVFSIGNDNIDGCKRGPTSCLGSVYWNWGPLYVSLLDQVRKGALKNEVVNPNITTDSKTSLVSLGISANTTAVDSGTKLVAGDALSKVAAGQVNPFRGPLSVSSPDQTPADQSALTSATPLSDLELNEMCWFVKGVTTWNPAADGGKGGLVDARVPDGTFTIEANESFDRTPDCRKNR